MSGQPPPLSSDVTDDIASSSEQDLQGTAMPGQDDIAAAKPDSKEPKDAKEGTNDDFHPRLS